ncbi:MAG: clan AA aspartic protease [Opitutales bacterium]|nr:clan AA aspartic protease [Opitutales bacterium]
MKFIFAAVTLFLGTTLSASALPLAQPELAAAEQKATVDLMKMERDARCKQVLVTAMVNGQPMRMMLDTGASHTVLHDESAAKLKNAAWIDTSHIVFKGNSTQRPKMLIAALEVGPGVSPQHPVIVVSLAAVRSMMAEKIDGIVGMDLLGSLPFTFDLRNNELYWGAPGKGSLVPISGERDVFGRLFAKLKCGGNDFSLLLDTGSSVTRVFKKDWKPGVAGEITAHIGDVDTASRQKMTEGNPGKIEIAPGVELKEVSPLICDETEHAILGMDALEGSALVHLPSETSPHGAFFIIR